MHRQLFFLFYLISFLSGMPLMHASGPDSFYHTDIADFEAEPSCHVGNVNVITGNFVDFERDVSVVGQVPLTFERCKENSGYGGKLGGGWNHNWTRDLKFSRNHQEHHHAHYNLTFVGSQGESILFDTRVTSRKSLNASASPIHYACGLTNCGSGELSGRTHLKNMMMYFYNEPEACHFKKGDGTWYFFSKVKDRGYKFEKELLPNLNYITLEKNNREETVRTFSRHGRPLSWLKITYPEKWKDRPQILVTTSDGKKVSYEFRKNLPKSSPEYDKNNIKWSLSCILREEAPSVFYTFLQSDITNAGAIISKNYPDGRFLHIDYYRYHRWQEFPPNYEKKKKIRDRNDHRLNKVMRLRAPLENDLTPHTLYEFVYEKVKGKDFDEEGITTVYNAVKDKTVYTHQNQRLTSVQRFDEKGNLYSIEKLCWGEQNSELNCNLMSRSLEDASGRVFYERSYHYDSRHNVVEESIRGDICGRGEIDCLTKRARYSEDGLNLPIWQDDGKNQVEITYIPNTNMIISKIQRGYDGLYRREFYDYDDCGVKVLEIVDDGISTDRNDLTGVTERRVRRFELNEKGQALVVRDFYTDTEGQEQFLKMEVNEYNSIGRLIGQEVYGSDNILAYVLKWDYDPMGNVTYEKNALGQEIHRNYDLNGNLVYECGPDPSYHKTWHYNHMNRMIRVDEVYDDKTFSTHCNYNRMGNRTHETDAYGNTTRFYYDFRQLLSRIESPLLQIDGQQPTSLVKQKEYDLLGHLTAEVDNEGDKTSWVNNLFGKPTLKIYPDGSVETTEYDLYGHPVKFVAKNGLVKTWTYDSLGRIIEETEGGVTIKKLTYSAFHLLSEMDASGLVTYFEYDRAGRKISERKGTLFTLVEYDVLGREVAFSTNTTRLEKTYDLLNRVTCERMYDLSGKLLSEIRWAYDALGRKTDTWTTADEGLIHEEKRYNSKGDLVWHKDAVGNITAYFFDYDWRNELGQRVPRHLMIDHLGRRVITTCDALGRTCVVEKSGFGGSILQKKTCGYNLKGKRVRSTESVFIEDEVVGEIVNLWEWDKMGELISVTEGAGTPEQKRTYYNYNHFGQKIEVVKPDGRSIKYEYDHLGRISRLSAEGLDYTYEYDVMNRPVKVFDHINSTCTTRHYNSEHRLVEESLAHGLSMRYAYNDAGQLSEMSLPLDGTIAYSYEGPRLSCLTRCNQLGEIRYKARFCQYDLTGHLKELLLPGGIRVTRKRDPLQRLLEVVSPAWEQTCLTYDPVGNLTGYRLQDNEGVVETQFTYDDLDQIASEKGTFFKDYKHDSLYNLVEEGGQKTTFNALNQPQSDSIHFDRNGNLVQKGDHQFVYDPLDRLIEVSCDGEKSVYTYDPFNRRLTANERKFLYQDENEIGLVEENRLKEFRALGFGLGPGAEIGAAVAFEIEGEVFSPICDQSGNVAALYDSTGSLVSTIRTSAFGETEFYGEVASPWMFSSKRLDPETGLYFFGRRYYDPKDHRFITADPIKFDGGTNLYAYCQNRPLNLNDLYGLSPCGFDLNTVWGLLANAFISAINTTGCSINYIGKNCVPLPVVRDIVMAFGHIFSGSPLSTFVPSSKNNRSKSGVLPGTNDTPGNIHYMTNGINTTEEEFMESVKDC